MSRVSNPSPVLLDVPVAGRLLGLSQATTYRRIKEFPLLPTSGRKKVVRAKLEEMIGRHFSDEEIAAAQNADATNGTPEGKTGTPGNEHAENKSA
jgi:hypothetical protein